MCQKWEGDCGLWVPILKKYAESLKKTVGAIWELPVKLANPTQFGWKWAGLSVLAGNSQMAPTIIFHIFSIYIFNIF